MARPPVEVADVIRAAGDAFFDGSRKWFTWLHLKVLTAILRCRTAALGGHVDECSGCGHRAITLVLQSKQGIYGLLEAKKLTRNAGRAIRK